MNIKKILGILLATCFMLSVTIASVSAAPGPGSRDGAKGYGQATTGYFGKNSLFSNDMGKWNAEKRNWDNQKSRWDNDRKKWDNERKGWNNKKHGNDYNEMVQIVPPMAEPI